MPGFANVGHGPLQENHDEASGRPTTVVRIAALALIGVLAAIGVRAIGIQALRITSGSMEPSVQTGQWVIVRRATAPSVAPRRVAVFFFPQNSKRLAIKRVIAGPGDVVDATTTAITVNGKRVATLPPQPRGVEPPVSPGRLAPRTVYLLGDNLSGSIDSRSFGPIPTTQLAGTVLAVVPQINIAIVFSGIALLAALTAGYATWRGKRRRA